MVYILSRLAKRKLTVFLSCVLIAQVIAVSYLSNKQKAMKKSSVAAGDAVSVNSGESVGTDGGTEVDGAGEPQTNGTVNVTPENAPQGVEGMVQGPVQPQELAQFNAPLVPSCKKHPDALVIGFSRCGTGALMFFLALHPQLKILSGNNEAFNPGANFYQQTAGQPCMPPLQKSIQKLAYQGTPENVYGVNQNMKILVVVRDPTDRAISHWHLLKSTGISIAKYTFEDTVKPFLEASNHGSILLNGMYAKRLTPWLGYFQKTQFHVVDGKMLAVDPASELQKVERFLEVDPYINSAHFKTNEVTGFPCLAEGNRAVCPIARVATRAGPVDSGIRSRVKDFYKSYNNDFFQLFSKQYDWNEVS